MQVIVNEADKLYELLKNIQENNPTSVATLIPDTERVFEINLSTRQIQSPDEIITVKTDHKAETLYFKVNRYFDNFDLAETVCVIEYTNSLGEDCIYPVPYYDIDTYSVRDSQNGIDEPMILFPWLLSGTVSKEVGTVSFSIMFFKLDDSGHRYTFKLNTLPSSLKVVKGIDIKEEDVISDEDFQEFKSDWQMLLEEMKKVADTGGKLYWSKL